MKVYTNYTWPMKLGNKKWSQIKKADIQKRHTDIGANNSEYQANRVLSLVSTIFDVSITLELLEKDAIILL